MPKNNSVTKEYFDEKFKAVEERLKKMDEKLNTLLEKFDWLFGKYRNHDEEHTLVNGTLSDHGDRLEKIEEKLGITV